MVVTSLTGTTTPVKLPEIPKVENTVSETQVIKSASKKEIGALMSTEQYVRKYFKDIPIMIEIARCESTFRQLDDDGEVHRGRVVQEDVGVMQINEYYHLDQAIKKNINIYSLDGNLAYARDLYERQGTTPWNSSKPCWGKYQKDTLAMN
jgi:hypothetical protein